MASDGLNPFLGSHSIQSSNPVGSARSGSGASSAALPAQAAITGSALSQPPRASPSSIQYRVEPLASSGSPALEKVVEGNKYTVDHLLRIYTEALSSNHPVSPEIMQSVVKRFEPRPGVLAQYGVTIDQLKAQIVEKQRELAATALQSSPQASTLKAVSVAQGVIGPSKPVVRPTRQNGHDLIKGFFDARNTKDPQSITTMRAIIAQVRENPVLLDGHKNGDGTPLTIQNLEDMTRSKIVMLTVSGMLGPIAEDLAAQIVATPHLAIPSGPEVEHREVAAGLMGRWNELIRTNNGEVIGELAEIVGTFSSQPQLLTSYTIADSKPLDLQDLKDELRVKAIDLILQGKLEGNIGKLLGEIKNPATKEEAKQIIDGSEEVRQALRSSPRVIRNPSNNCFMDAALVSLLDNPVNYAYITAAIGKIAANDQSSIYNPTILGANPELVRACETHPLDVDYTRWQIGDNGQKVTTFLRMTVRDAARCANALIEKWHSGKELSSDESTLLRLSLSKLSNKKYDPVGSPGKFPHITIPNMSSILPGSPEDTLGFTHDLMDGLDTLAPDLHDGNPFKGFKVESEYDMSKSPIGSGRDGELIYPTCDVIRATGLETRISPEIRGELTLPNLNGIRIVYRDLVTRGVTPPPVLNISYTDIPGIPKPDFTLLQSLLEDEQGYQLDSFVVRAAAPSGQQSYGAGSGHYVTLKKVQVNGKSVWLCYDDIKPPHVRPVSAENIERILQGKAGDGFTPLSFVFSKPPTTQLSDGLVRSLASSNVAQPLPRVTDRKTGQSLLMVPHTPEGLPQGLSVEGELQQSYRKLIAEGKLDIAANVAKRLQNPEDRISGLQAVLRAANSERVLEPLRSELESFKNIVQSDLANLISQRPPLAGRVSVASSTAASSTTAPRGRSTAPNRPIVANAPAGSVSSRSSRSPGLVARISQIAGSVIRSLSPSRKGSPPPIIGRVGTPQGPSISAASSTAALQRAVRTTLSTPGTQSVRPSVGSQQGSVVAASDAQLQQYERAFETAMRSQNPSAKIETLRALLEATIPAIEKGSLIIDNTKSDNFKNRLVNAIISLEEAQKKAETPPPRSIPSAAASVGPTVGEAFGTFGEFASRSEEKSPMETIRDVLANTTSISGGTINAIGFVELFASQSKLSAQEINKACLLVGKAACRQDDEGQDRIARRALKLMTVGLERTELEGLMLGKGWSLTPPTSSTTSGRPGEASSAPSVRPRAGMARASPPDWDQEPVLGPPKSIPSAEASISSLTPAQLNREILREISSKQLDKALNLIERMPDGDQKNNRIFWIGVLGLVVRNQMGAAAGALLLNLIDAAENNINKALKKEFESLKAKDKMELFKELSALEETDPDKVINSLVEQINKEMSSSR